MPGNSKTHALVDANAWRPKSKQWKRKNKANARAKSATRHDALRSAFAKGGA